MTIFFGEISLELKKVTSLLGLKGKSKVIFKSFDLYDIFEIIEIVNLSGGFNETDAKTL